MKCRRLSILLTILAAAFIGILLPPVRANNAEVPSVDVKGAKIEKLKIYYVSPMVTGSRRMRHQQILIESTTTENLYTLVSIEGVAINSLNEKLSSTFIVEPVHPYLRDTLNTRILFEFTTPMGVYYLSWEPDWTTEWINNDALSLDRGQVEMLLKLLPVSLYEEVLLARDDLKLFTENELKKSDSPAKKETDK